MSWTRKYKACLLCGLTRYPHHGKGLCTICHPKIWRHQNPEKVSEQAATSYTRNYVLRNETVLARRRERYRENAAHRENARENARRQYRKHPELYKQRSSERRERIDRDAFEKLKPKVLERDGHKCVKCDETTNLHVHHINLDGSDHRMENLITLCSFHHKSLPAHHAHRRIYS